MPTSDHTRLRPLEPADLPRVFEMQSDAESNRMAAVIPRTREAFEAHWEKTQTDPAVVARIILVGDEFAGLVACFPRDGGTHVGYWIDRPRWGQGIASRALELLLQEVTSRPLVATAASSNVASVRVLQKNGFVVERVHHAPADDRHVECEETVLVLT